MGNEFGAVEALWSQFEGAMAKEGGKEGEGDEGGKEEADEDEDEGEGEGEEEGEGEGEGEGDTVVEKRR